MASRLAQWWDDLSATFTVGQWIIDVYTLALAALVVALGTLGDRVGHRRLFLVGLAVFRAASVALMPQSDTRSGLRPPVAISSAVSTSPYHIRPDSLLRIARNRAGSNMAGYQQSTAY